MTSDPLDCFSESYAVARASLLQAAVAAGCPCAEYIEPGTGAQGEILAMDAVWAGPADAHGALLLTSACHGVEGHAGSAAQIGLLRDWRLLQSLSKLGVAVLIVHALNPHGFSHMRRCTSENVDLNRNFIDFYEPLPANETYRELHPLLVPQIWPPSSSNEQALGQVIQRQGMRGFQEAVTRGQYEFSDGLFFGGYAPSWSHLSFRELLRTRLSAPQRVAWIDIHSGLGPTGVGERIFNGGCGFSAEVLARDWWGAVTKTEDGSSTSAELCGTLASLVQTELDGRLASSIALEFGTVEPLQVLGALRADACAWRPGVPVAARQQAVAEVRQAFYVDTPVWKNAVFEQSMSAIQTALRGIADMIRAPT
ncbi:MAG: M14 family metallopeptidase [Burkholderiaceae bacterium]|jgi:hypothetical protein|nr:M14 family metallopeptidase [Burkholderiaceae bacterium]